MQRQPSGYAAVAGGLEAPLAPEVAEVSADVLAGQPARLVVDLAQPVAHRLETRVNLVLHDRAATGLVALEHAHVAHRPLPLRQRLEVRQRVEAGLRRRCDVRGVALTVGGHRPARLPPHGRAATAGRAARRA